MGDHAEMLHAAPTVVYSGAGAAPHGGWWNAAAVPAATCSTELAGFGTWSSALAASYDIAVEGGKATKSATTASSESPGNNSSVTFQEPTSVTDPVGIGAAVHQQPLAAGYTDWTHPYISSGATLHGFLQDSHQDMSSRTEQSPMVASSLMNPSSNNLALQGQDHHQLLSSFGSELLLSPTSPYGFQSSSILRSLMEPTAKPALPGFQQYDQYGQQMGQASPAAAGRFAPGAIREQLQFTNDAPFWNSSAAGFGVPAAAAPDQASVRSVVKQSPAPRAATLAIKTALEGVGESSSIIIKKKANGEPAFKKPRLETPSPLPTFKVRKEKLGDRITALQQLVAPFGKTDTASVLHETIEYIKFLHDQVGALSAPYLKNGHQVPHLKQSSSPEKSKDSSHGEISLKGRGLCLVPISSTFAVASEVPVDFWTPFGPNFR
ncbi:Transcription factor bHLH112 [Dichanthelium oligosanthes]|uniref:Transcription factor bHLH112 n=1 Tax=Dichanthelium oligosanthes TaxID=888268 RepID=A0A1E5VU63_9POAL|nr:Transcription factor bHLH112 [Dichanthelium oligosanthes]